MGADSVPNLHTPSDVPDVLAPGLDVVFVGINPGRVSAAAAAHFANPRNDFWRLLHDAGFTPRLYEPQEQFELLELGIGVTNAAYRTTPGSGDLRRSDFAESAARLERLARELRPRAFAFVGKEAFRGAFGLRPELGVQERALLDTGTFVLPSTSPANAAVPYAERLHWFRELAAWLAQEPVERLAVRGLVVDEAGETILLRWQRPQGSSFWITPGGAIERGETELEALRRELGEEIGLVDPELGPCLWSRSFTYPMLGSWRIQRERCFLVPVRRAEVEVQLLTGEDVHGARWFTAAEIMSSDELFAPARIGELLAEIVRDGPPDEPIDAGL
jgi:G:T/U-mismatch repair DNA glycosylase/8-oxo-dGTP pyrophosphatase MutT (NUDIX family)